MLSKDHIILHVNDIHSIVWVIISQVLQYLELNPSLVVVLLFIFDNFESDHFLSFVVETPNGLPERAFSQELLDFIPVANVIVHAHFIVAFVIVIPIIKVILHRSLSFALAVLTNVEYLWVVYDLLELILGEVLFSILESNLGSGRFFYILKTIHGRSCFQRHKA